MSTLSPTPPSCVPNLCSPCPPCADFQIKRHDTVPAFKVSVEDENGPIDLNGLVLEASMWGLGRLKKNITATDTSLQLADNLGFEQCLPNDIIVPDRVRSTEYMLITGFDEINQVIFVSRGFNGTTPDSWKRGTKLRIFRFMSSPAVTEMVFEDITKEDGCVEKDVLSESLLVYEWNQNDTCVPGCFFLEFKLLKLSGPVVIPSVTPVCTIGVGVEWVRRFPICGEFNIRICDSSTAEAV